MNRRVPSRLPGSGPSDKTTHTAGDAGSDGIKAPQITSETALHEAFLSNVDVRDPNLVVVTAEHSDPRINSSVQEVLRLLRDVKGVDVVFVANMTDCGRHSNYGPAAEDTVEHVSAPTDSLEALWGERVVDARAQHECAQAGHPGSGRHIHSRIVSASGKAYGMLCCICEGENATGFRVDQKTLRHTAALTAMMIEKSMDVSLLLQPKDDGIKGSWG